MTVDCCSLILDETLGTINSQQREMLDMAKDNIDRLARLINQVLTTERFESGKMEYMFAKHDINKIINQVSNDMQFLAKKKKLKIILKLDQNLPKVKIDKDKIIEVLINLIDNAIKFTEQGFIKIISRKENKNIKIIVEDSGRAIKEEDIGKIFQKFAQIERKPGGTGLGLTISKTIIEAHKGQIWVESIYGKGSKFNFIIPI